MSEESLGTAKVDIVVDTTQFDTAINKAKTSVSGMSQAAQAEYAKLQGSEKRRVDSLIRQADQLGLTRQQQILYNAELKKVPTAVLDELKNKVAASTAAVSGGVSQMNQYGMSAKATAAAMRGVPAQITDIVTSLQGGQRPMTVLLQQGGQLKDMFGGIAPAARALGTAVLSMVNPYTLAAGAAAALTAVWVAGSNESQRFTQSLILTGNYSGFTADQLGSMADRMSNVTGTAGKAADALTKLVSTGRFTGGVIEEIGLAAIAMEKATGQAVDKTIGQFEELGKSPSDAILKLNDQYHFLTASVYEQIASLEQQNQKDEAAALAQRTFAAAVQRRAGEVTSSAGLLERAWSGIAGAAKGAWDAMLNIGRPTPVSDLRKQAEQIQEQINKIQLGSKGFAETGNGAAVGGGNKVQARALRLLKAQLAELNGTLTQATADEVAARAKAQQQQLEDEKIAARQRLDIQKKATRDRKTLRKDEIEQLHKDAKLLGLVDDEQTKNLEAAILAKYKDPKGSTSGPRDDAAIKLLQQLRERETATQAQLASEQKLSTAQQERVKYEQLFSDLKNKQVLTADQKSLLLNESLIKAQLDRNVAAEQELRTKKEAVKVDAMRASLSATLAADQQQYAEQLKAVGLGRQAQEELRAQQRLFRDYQRDLQRATQSMLEGGVSQETYQKQTELLQGSLDDRLALQRRYYDNLRTAQEDWRNGAKASLADYVNATRDVAGMTGQLFTNAFKGMEDALTSFVTTGKLSFSDLANSIIADMVRIAVQQNITGPLASALGSFFNPTAPSGVTPGLNWTFDKNAKGNVYDSLSLSQYSNQIHDTPKLFQFAKGAGVFAEAGPEAIMPLKRGSDGSLGVRAQLPDAGGVVVNINNQGQAMTATGQPKISRDSMGRMVIDVMTKDLQANGPYIRQLKGAMA